MTEQERAEVLAEHAELEAQVNDLTEQLQKYDALAQLLRDTRDALAQEKMMIELTLSIEDAQAKTPDDLYWCLTVRCSERKQVHRLKRFRQGLCHVCNEPVLPVHTSPESRVDPQGISRFQGVP